MPAQLLRRFSRRVPIGERLGPHIVSVGLLLIAVLCYSGWTVHRHFTDPSFVFLTDDGPAKWIVCDDPFDSNVHPAGAITRAFRVRLHVVGQFPPQTALRIRALKRWNILMDGKLVGGNTLPEWKTEYKVPVGAYLTPGEHELRFLVENESGPVALRVACGELNIYSDERWESSADGASWRGVRLAATRVTPPLSLQFESVGSAIVSKLPSVLLVFGTIGLAAYFVGRRQDAKLDRYFSPPLIRWLVMGAWCVLGANNIFKLPPPAGFDVPAHIDYINFIISQKRLPLAPDGPEMFQAPLYYLIAAPITVLFLKFKSGVYTACLLRSISLLAGLAKIEICYRATKLVFPNRPNLQILGILFAAFLPVNLYISQYVGNEPLASTFASATLLLCLHELQAERRSGLRLAGIGLFWGLALLTKVSAIILLLPITFVVAYRFFSAPAPRLPAAKEAIRTFSVIAAVATLIAGWYYLRNWIHLGRPLASNWGPNSPFQWWQDPGFWTPKDVFRFGAGLVHPIAANAQGFLNGVFASFWCDSALSSAIDLKYAPKWNYPYLLASVGLALLPTVALILGTIRGLRTGTGPLGRALLLAVFCAVGYFGALFHYFLSLPYQVAIKALYTIGGMPAYTLLVVAGFELLGRNLVTRCLIYAGMGTWAFTVFCAYLVQGGGS